MLRQKILPLLIILILSSCGYESIYINKKDSSLFKKIILSGDKKINKKIVSLSKLKINKEIDNNYAIIINSKKERLTIAKDGAGNSSVYKLIISIDIKIEKDDKTFKEKLFTKSFVYSNLETAFDLLQYQKEVEKNLLVKLSDQINIFLTLQ